MHSAPMCTRIAFQDGINFRTSRASCAITGETFVAPLYVFALIPSYACACQLGLPSCYHPPTPEDKRLQRGGTDAKNMADIPMGATKVYSILRGNTRTHGCRMHICFKKIPGKMHFRIQYESEFGQKSQRNGASNRI